MGLPGPPPHRRPDDRTAAGRAAAVVRGAARLHRRARRRPRPVAQRRLGSGAAEPLPRSRLLRRPIRSRRCRASTTRRCRSSAATRCTSRACCRGAPPSSTAGSSGRSRSLSRPSPSAYVLDDIVLFSAILCHYVADGHVPLHAVTNYDGQLLGQLGAHSRFESQLYERFSGELTIAPVPRAAITDPRGDMFRILLESNRLAERVLTADRAAAAGREFYDDGFFAAFKREALPIVDRRIADAISATRGLHHRGLGAGGPPGRPHPAVAVAAPDRQAGGRAGPVVAQPGPTGHRHTQWYAGLPDPDRRRRVRAVLRGRRRARRRRPGGRDVARSGGCDEGCATCCAKPRPSGIASTRPGCTGPTRA